MAIPGLADLLVQQFLVTGVREMQRLEATFQRMSRVLEGQRFSPVPVVFTDGRSEQTEQTEYDLSHRESQVLVGLLAGQRVANIAAVMEISPNTVRNHLKAIFVKVGVHSQIELLQRVRSWAWVE